MHLVSLAPCLPHVADRLHPVMQAVVPFLSASVPKAKGEKVALDVLAHFFKEMQEKTRVVEEEEDGEDLCDCEFSLAYGAFCCLHTASTAWQNNLRL